MNANFLYTPPSCVLTKLYLTYYCTHNGDASTKDHTGGLLISAVKSYGRPTYFSCKYHREAYLFHCYLLL
jgi:hypothetical protein